MKWKGDLDDDCTAIDGDYMLRAEDMGDYWWWATSYKNDTIDAEWNYNTAPENGKEARKLAEKAMKKHKI